MINMSYCMCRNTRLAFEEVLYRLGDGFKLTREEADEFADTLKLVLEYCASFGIIEEVDDSVYKAVEEHANYFRVGDE